MNVSLARTCALAALLVSASAAYGQSGPVPAPPAAIDLRASSFDVGATPVVSLPAALEPSLELMHITIPDEQVLGVHYRPRSNGWGRHMDSQTVTQIHLGFFDPEGTPGSEFLIGARGGPMLDPHVQLGVGLDWSHITDNASTVSHQSSGPNGTTITVKQDLSRASTDFYPIMAFVQFSGDDGMTVIPYFGLAGGYEFMSLSADNFQTNQSFDATYGGWGWQVWAGAALPLSGQVRLSGEVYLNTAEPGRDVTDAINGTYRETVSANGSGIRIGMAWGF